MIYTIIKRYRDAELKRVLNVGEEIDLKNTQRVKELKDAGCIKLVKKAKK